MTVATLHHLACTGGTVISKCLAAMDGAYVVSEVHPYVTTPIHFEPMAPGLQFQAQYGRLTKAEMDRLFVGQIGVLERRADRDDKVLLLRDHSHSDFTAPDGARRPVVSDLLAKRRNHNRPPWAATVRDPLEAYLSLTRLGWHLGQTFDAYCVGWLAFAAAYAEAPMFFYEDFCDDPQAVIRGLSAALGIPFQEDFLTRVGERALTGDSGRSAPVIEVRPWRKLPSDLVDGALVSPAYARILDQWPRYRRNLDPLRDKQDRPVLRGKPVAAYAPKDPGASDSAREVEMNDTTPRLGLPLVAEGQAQKHVTHNEALMALDAMVQASVRSRSMTVEPELAEDGDSYILPTERSGPSWSLMTPGDLAVVRDGTWTTLGAIEGAVLFVIDEGRQVVRVDDQWREVVSAPWGEGRNRLINGRMDLWTRGTSVDISGPGWAFLADRWRVYASDGWSCGYARLVLAPDAAGPPARQAVRLDIARGEGGGFVQIYQAIEGVDVFCDEAVTVSAFVRSSGDASIAAQLWRDFGEGGSSSYAIVEDAMALDGHWRRLSWTISVPALTGATIGANSALGVVLRVSCDADVQIDVTCIQIESGVQPTPVERRSPSLEQTMARRYYRRSATQLDPDDLAYEMRTTPIESGEGPYDYDAEL